MKEAKKNVKIPIYGGTLHIVVTDEENAYDAAMRHFAVDDEQLRTFEAVTLSGDTGCMEYPVVICGGRSPGLIAHEAKHVVNKVFKTAGIKLDRDNDEAEAYLLSWIVNRIWEVKLMMEKKDNG